jgi:translation initiation factor eIF-2B subunit alpha
LLERAAKNAAGKFRVVYVRDDSRAMESDQVVKELRDMGIPVAEIHCASVAHVLGLLRQVDMVFVGAEAVTQNGGIISRIGTFQIAQLASQANIPFYVAAETHKFVRKFPLDQRDIGFEQKVLDFGVEKASKQPTDAVDYTVSFLLYFLLLLPFLLCFTFANFCSLPSSSLISSRRMASICPATFLSNCSKSMAV